MYQSDEAKSGHNTHINTLAELLPYSYGFV